MSQYTKIGDSFVWTDCEVELLLNVILEYKAGKISENVDWDWESCRSKYPDIMALFLEQFPTETNTDFPHRKEEVNRNILTTKLKMIRLKYRAAVVSGRKMGHGRVVMLYFDLCEKIWGGSPATTTLTSGLETADNEPDSMESADPSDPSSCGTHGDVLARQPPTKRPRGDFFWTDSEVELLLNVTLEYKVAKSSENVDWESCRSKYPDILVLFLERCPTETNTDFPHRKEEVNKNILTTKLKLIRVKYRAAVDSGRKNSHGRVVMLYFDLCEQIFGQGGSPATTTTLTSGLERADIDPESMESADPSEPTSCGAQGDVARQPPAKRADCFVWTDSEVELLLNVTLEYKVAKSFENVHWESCRSKYPDILALFLERCPTETNTDFPHRKEEVNRNNLTTKLKAIRGKYREAVDAGRKGGHGKVVMLYFDLCEKIWGGSPATTTTIPSGLETADIDPESMESTDPSEPSSCGAQGSPILPLSSLRLIVPPLQLVSAALWEIMKKGAVRYYGILEEFVSTLLEAVPDMLTYREGVQLVMGLRARVVLELCRNDEAIPHTIQPHLTSIKNYITKMNKEGSDLEVKTSMTTFFQLVNSLVDDSGQRDTFYKNIFPVVFGPKYDSALQALMMKLLSRLQKLLPVPNLEQTADWLSLSPSILKECVELVNKPQPLNTLIQHHKVLKSTTEGLSSSGEEDCILSSLSYDFRKEDASTRNTSTNYGSTSAPEGWQNHVSIDKDFKTVEKTHETTWNVVGGEERHVKDEPEDRGHSIEVELQHDPNDSSDIEIDTKKNTICRGCGKTFTYPKSFDKHQKSCVVMNKINGQTDPKSSARFWVRPCQPDPNRVILACNFQSTDQPHEKHLEEIGMPEMKDGKVALLTSSADLTEDHQRQPGVIMCTMCEKNFSQIVDMKKHYSESHQVSGPYPCPLCKRSFVRLGELVLHHKKQKLYQCSSCTKCFTNLRQLNMHETMHEKLWHICTTCRKSFKSLSHLIQHQKIHKKQQPWICSHCSKQFSQKRYLTTHMVQHTGGYPCPTCGKKFNQKTYLKWHQYEHTGQNHKYLCDTCGKGWPTQAQLKQHMIKHTEERPFECEDCGVFYKRHKQLTAHRRDKHIKLRPFVCEVCSKAFRLNSNLKVHLMVHTGERPFMCPRCGKTFARKYRLRKHRKDKTCLEIA